MDRFYSQSYYITSTPWWIRKWTKVQSYCYPWFKDGSQQPILFGGLAKLYNPSDLTWEPTKNVSNTWAIVEKFHQQYTNKLVLQPMTTHNTCCAKRGTLSWYCPKRDLNLWPYDVVAYFVHIVKNVQSTLMNRYEEIEGNVKIKHMLHAQGKIWGLYFNVNNPKLYHYTNSSLIIQL